MTTDLASYGVALEDVDAVVVTHWHGNHAGGADHIQNRSGAVVYAHEVDAPLIEQDSSAMEAMKREARDLYEEWGMPEEKQRALVAYRDRSRDAFGGPAAITPVVDGTTLEVSGRNLWVVHAPDHTAGSICLVGDDAVLTGDALLPVYTPNVGGADTRIARPLDRYVETLQAIVKAEYHRAYPGHREPIGDPTARARDILRHHERRSRRVLSVLEELGAADAWTVSAELFGTLEEIHVLHGPGEAHAHLDHLERHGYVAREEGLYHRVESSAGGSEPAFVN